MHIPLSDLRQKLATLDKSKVYYLTEEGGHRSDVAAHILCQNSFKAKVVGS
jgi:rhodanese-related sulfurtransferase